ncbi:MAG: redoxin domain-containing protein [Catenulispora sp.]|nr:redoxin domain-containing protein [Catenulispora sp.]
MVEVGDRLEPLTLYDPDGRPVNLAGLLDRPAVVPLVRYYGCMPCKAFLHELEDARTELESLGVGIFAVGGAADYQARDLIAHGIGYELLLDPEHRLYEALDVRRIHWWVLLKPGTWRRYLRAAHRARQGRITGHLLQAPGLALIDADRTVRFLYRGQTLGDYPSISEILVAAKKKRTTS